MLSVSTKNRGEVVHLSLAGQLDGSPCCETLSAEVKAKLSEGSRQFVLDLSELDWANSCGIGCFISAYVSVKREGGSIQLLSPNSRVLQVLTITNLVPTVFQLVGAQVESATPE